MVISIVGSMLISLCAVHAQQTEQDGTANRDRERQQERQSDQDQRERKRAYRDRWQQQSDRAKEENWLIREKPYYLLLPLLAGWSFLRQFT